METQLSQPTMHSIPQPRTRGLVSSQVGGEDHTRGSPLTSMCRQWEAGTCHERLSEMSWEASHREQYCTRGPFCQEAPVWCGAQKHCPRSEGDCLSLYFPLPNMNEESALQKPTFEMTLFLKLFCVYLGTYAMKHTPEDNFQGSVLSSVVWS